ncbi:MAG: hypothetical protein DLM55_05005 [Acidimicrobiales bacterium]|nr:MAG: hypothetical protein DLM55_05005 [Acidimicrobiales bacterium]
MVTQRGGKNRRAAPKSRWAAHLPDELKPAREDLVSGAALDGVYATGNLGGEPGGDIVENAELTNMRWNGGQLIGRRFRRLHCRNVVFENCDLSGVIIEESSLSRVEFQECRMSGMVFGGSKIEDVLFSSCKLDLANLRMTKGKRLEFLACDLREADFYGGDFADTRIYDSNLSSANYTQASMDGLRLHGSVLWDLKGASALEGVVISQDQLMDMSVALFADSAISIDDER